ncbi:MAG: hypothetical protein ACKORM_00790 [Solirubrobacterales bacterium]
MVSFPAPWRLFRWMGTNEKEWRGTVRYATAPPEALIELSREERCLLESGLSAVADAIQLIDTPFASVVRSVQRMTWWNCVLINATERERRDERFVPHRKVDVPGATPVYLRSGEQQAIEAALWQIADSTGPLDPVAWEFARKLYWEVRNGAALICWGEDAGS